MENKIYVRLIDENGMFVEDAFVDELNERTISAPCPKGMKWPQWNGAQWVDSGLAFIADDAEEIV